MTAEFWGAERSPAMNNERSRRQVARLPSVRTYLGPESDAPIEEEHQNLEHHELFWSRVRVAFRESFAGVFESSIMFLFGDGFVAQVLLSAGQTEAPGGIWLWCVPIDPLGLSKVPRSRLGLGVMLGIYACGNVN